MTCGSAPRRWRAFAAVALVAAVALPAVGRDAMAEQASVEDRLREALRRTTIELRALQDSQAGQQAALREATKQKDLLKQSLDLQNARIAELEGQAAQASVLEQREAALRQDFLAVQANNDALLEALKQWQAAYEEVAAVARTKDGERQRAEAGLAQTRETLSVCQQKNDKLVSVADDILNLYQSQDFVSVLIRSYEPVLGLQKVELQNIVQDYQDKILDQRFSPPAPVGSPEATPAH
jgi:chromosome segregation ATPase